MRFIIVILTVLAFASFTFAQSVDVKDADNHILMQVNDEGTIGSIIFPDTSGALASHDNRLYSLNDKLIWHGNELATSGSADGDWSITGNDMYSVVTGNVGIGTAIPSYKLDVIGGGIRLDESNGLRIENSSLYSILKTDGNNFRMLNFSGGDLRFYTAPSAGETSELRMTIENDGDVGIGVMNPTALLDVAGTAQVTGFKLPTGASDGHVLTSDGSGVGTWQAAVSLPDGDWTISGDDIYSTVSGNVGIGTDSPESRLHIKAFDATDQSGLHFETSLGTGEDWSIFMDGSDNLRFRNDASTLVTFSKDNGYVGIGDATPNYQLDVVGTAQVTGFKMPTGASDGHILTSDATGEGTWQEVSAPTGLVPIGTVINWWRPNATFTVPIGYQICDGGVVSDSDSPYNSVILPDLREIFVMGALDENSIGSQGGSDQHHHLNGPPNFSMSTDGSHNHFVDPPNASTTHHNSNLVGVKGITDSDRYIIGDSSHNHEINIPGFLTNSIGDHKHIVYTTSYYSDYTVELPPYVGLLKIMRIK